MSPATRFAALALLSAAPAALGCSCGAETLDFGDSRGGGGDTPTVPAGGGGAGADGGGASGGGDAGGNGGGAVCGNDVTESGEQCDGADLGRDDCFAYGFNSPEGLACSRDCSSYDPSGCHATCGDGFVEPGEDCDGEDPGSHDCTEAGFADPDGATCLDCVVDYSMCAAECGNGLSEPGEACDGADLGGATCVDHGFADPGALACNATCDGVDLSGCAAACNGTLEPGEVCDGADLNGNDCTDFGYVNPGGLACTACMLDPSGCTPVCGNGTIEPGENCDDGNTANGDGCSATCTTAGATCADAIPVSLGPGTQTFTGTTAGGGLHASACASAAPDRVYAVTASEAGFLTASLTRANTAYPSVLYVRTTCDDAGSTLLCANSTDPAGAQTLNGGEILSVPVAANQTVFVFVDGAAAGDTGNYELVLDLSLGTTCTDPVPIRLEKGTPMRFIGNTAGKSQSTAGSCGGGGTLFGSSDVVYQVHFVNTDGPDVTASLDAAATNFNSVLYARGSCDNGFSQIACDNANGNGGESISFDPDGDTTIFIWVDGNNSAEGNYSLVLTPTGP